MEFVKQQRVEGEKSCSFCVPARQHFEKSFDKSPHLR